MSTSPDPVRRRLGRTWLSSVALRSLFPDSVCEAPFEEDTDFNGACSIRLCRVSRVLLRCKLIYRTGSARVGDTATGQEL